MVKSMFFLAYYGSSIGSGAILIFLNATNQLEFGIDFHHWKIGPKFKGLKFIPPGLHFLYYSNNGFRTGFFYEAQVKGLQVYQWDQTNECFVKETDQDQLERIRLNIREFDPFLGYYPLQDTEAWKKWTFCCNQITPRLLKQILLHPTISSMTSESEYSELWNEAKLSDLQHLDAMNEKWKKNEQSKEWVNFTHIDLKYSFPSGATAHEKTKNSIDKSFLLDMTLGQNYMSRFSLT